MSKTDEVREQRAHLEKVIGWAERIRETLAYVEHSTDMPVWFRPGSSGVSVIGLTPENPQRGRSGFTNIERLEQNLERVFAKHCAGVSQGRPTPEKQLQSFLIRGALRAHRRLVPFEAAAAESGSPVELFFMIDEIPVQPVNGGRIVCDLLAVREVPGGHAPVVIELKSDRQMKRLIEQVTGYAALVDRHADLFEQLFDTMSPFPVSLTFGGCFRVTADMHWGVGCMSDGEMIGSVAFSAAHDEIDAVRQEWPQRKLPALFHLELDLSSTGSSLRLVFQSVTIEPVGPLGPHSAPPPLGIRDAGE